MQLERHADDDLTGTVKVDIYLQVSEETVQLFHADAYPPHFPTYSWAFLDYLKQ